MTVGTLRGQQWFVSSAATLLIASKSLLLAVDSPAKPPTPSETKDGYVGTVYSRLPEHTYSSWVVFLQSHGGSPWGVSYVADRGVEMLWLESAPSWSGKEPQPLFKVVDVLVLPTTYKADGLVVTECRGSLGHTQRRAVVALTEPDTRKVHRAWEINPATATFLELSPAADTCTPMIIGGAGND